MKFSKSCFAMCLTFFLAQAMLFGQDEEKAKPIDRADYDSDGEVTVAELEQFLEKEYFDEWKEKFDREYDDSKLKEIFREYYQESWAKKTDANGNGLISKWELRLASKALDQVLKEAKRSAEKEKPRPMSSIERMDENFKSQKPLIGSDVEDLVALDESGNEVNFEGLRGKHVVIVFGCLT